MQGAADARVESAYADAAKLGMNRLLVEAEISVAGAEGEEGLLDDESWLSDIAHGALDNNQVCIWTMTCTDPATVPLLTFSAFVGSQATHLCL